MSRQRFRRTRSAAIQRRLFAYESLEDRRLLTANVVSNQTAWFATSSNAPAFSDATSWIVQLTDQGTTLAGDPSGVEPLLDSESINLSVVRGLGLPGMVLVAGPPSQANQIEAALQSHPLIASFQADRTIAGQAPNDPRFEDGSLYALENDGSFGEADADIDAQRAWDEYTTGSPRVTVGVIDSGVALAHPDLYLNIWINQGEIPPALRSQLTDIDGDSRFTFRDLNDPANADHVTEQPDDANNYIDAYDLLADPNWIDDQDNDGNGFLNDLFGWDFIGAGDQPLGAAGDNDPTDEHGHGTHVAGTIAAIGDNGVGVTGVSWSTSIMPLRFLDAERSGRISDAIAAIMYATMMRSQFGVDVPITNNSWGYRGEEDPMLRAALEANAAADMLFVAAAGNGDALGFGIDNDADPEFAFYPASDDLDHVVSVAATDSRDRLARFSNYGATTVDIAAPGVGILSTDIHGDDYVVRSGTSMAAPHVAGVAALLWAENPEATAGEVKAALLDPLAVDRPDGLSSRVASGGRLNAFGSLDSDTVAPRATIVDLPNIDGPGVTEVTFSVAFTDNRTLIGGSINADEIRVVDTFDGTELTSIELIDGPFPNADRVVATYRLTVTSGFNDGDFQVIAREGSVFDAAGNLITQTSIGTFNVDTTENLLRATVLADRNDTMPPLGSLSLREAVSLANGDNQVVHTIRLASGTYELGIAGSGEDAAVSGDLDITTHVIIKGAGANRTIIDANTIDRVFHVLGSGRLELRDVSVVGGTTAQNGGGVLIDAGGELELGRVMVYDNTAQFGGGVANFGDLVARRTTLHGNFASGGGGGIANDAGGSVTIISTTISGNQGSAAAGNVGGGGILNFGSFVATNATITANQTHENGGGVAQLGGSFTTANTIIAANVEVQATSPDAAGSFTSLGSNLIGSTLGNSGWAASDLLNVDPMLGPLQFNGGNLETIPVHTHVPLAGSPAIDAADDTLAPTSDQRGIVLPQDGDGNGTPVSDIGSVERYFAEITGVRFHDLNRNGVRDMGETGRSGIVYLDTNSNGRFDKLEPIALADENGAYTFNSIAPGNYAVGDILEPGWRASRVSYGESVELVSRVVTTQAANAPSSEVRLSGDGRFAVFTSSADNLVDGDTNGADDVFVYDIQAEVLNRVSISSGGAQANGASFAPSISHDGRFVAYLSRASNLVANDTNDLVDAFLHDRFTGTTERVSVAENGNEGDGFTYGSTEVSDDGRFVVFLSDSDNLLIDDPKSGPGIFVRDRVTSSTRWIATVNNGIADEPAPLVDFTISGNGQVIAFESWNFSLIPGQTLFGANVYAYEMQTETLELISVTTAEPPDTFGIDGISLSYDGGVVAFSSEASNLIANDTNGVADVFLRDRANQTTERVSLARNGQQANGGSTQPSISSDGRYVTFESEATNLVMGDSNGVGDVFVIDLQSGTNHRASIGFDSSEATGASLRPAISADGSWVAFVSFAENLVADDTNGVTDIFVADWQSESTRRANLGSLIVSADGISESLAISGDGRFVAFSSTAGDLVPNDTNNAPDIFLLDRQEDRIERISLGTGAVEANSGSACPSISADGRFVAFSSSASNLVPDDLNGLSDVFVVDRETGDVMIASVSNNGEQGSGSSRCPTLSADGSVVAFASAAENLSPGDLNKLDDIFVYDLKTNLIERVSDNENA